MLPLPDAAIYIAHLSTGGHRAVQRHFGFRQAHRERASRRVQARALIAGWAARTQVGKAQCQAEDPDRRCNKITLT